MTFVKMVALGAAALLACAPSAAQNIATLPNAATLTGAEKMTAAQGAGCPTKVQPCTIVAVNPAQIATYLAPTFQPKDADLDAIAALPTVDFGRQLLTKADAASIRSAIGGAASGTNSDITTLTGLTTALALSQGGTGATTAVAARTALGLGTIATQAASGVAITGGTLSGLTSASIGTPAGNGAFNVSGVGVGDGTLIYQQSIVSTKAFDQAGQAGLVFFGRYNSAGDLAQFGGISATKEVATSGDLNGYLSFFTRTTANGTAEKLRVTSGGVVRPAVDNTQILGAANYRWQSAYATQFRPGSGAPIWTSGAGTPLGNVTAPIGSLYTRTDGGAATTLYVKESGTDATGWVAK